MRGVGAHGSFFSQRASILSLTAQRPLKPQQYIPPSARAQAWSPPRAIDDTPWRERTRAGGRTLWGVYVPLPSCPSLFAPSTRPLRARRAHRRSHPPYRRAGCPPARAREQSPPWAGPRRRFAPGRPGAESASSRPSSRPRRLRRRRRSRRPPPRRPSWATLGPSRAWSNKAPSGRSDMGTAPWWRPRESPPPLQPRHQMSPPSVTAQVWAGPHARRATRSGNVVTSGPGAVDPRRELPHRRMTFPSTTQRAS